MREKLLCFEFKACQLPAATKPLRCLHCFIVDAKYSHTRINHNAATLLTIKATRLPKFAAFHNKKLQRLSLNADARANRSRRTSARGKQRGRCIAQSMNGSRARAQRRRCQCGWLSSRKRDAEQRAKKLQSRRLPILSFLVVSSTRSFGDCLLENTDKVC